MRQNLSSVCPTKLDSSQFTQLQRLARKMKTVAQSNYQTYLATYVSANQQCERSILKLWLSSLYFWWFKQQMPPVKEHFQLCAEWSLFKEYYDSDENEPYYLTQRKNRRSTWKKSLASSLQETNDEGACLESFNFSCVVSKLNVY